MRASPVERFYDPATLTPNAPRLYVWLDGEAWRLEDEAGTLLSTYPTQEDAIDAALARSRLRFSEILARGSNGRIEWRIDQDPELLRSVGRTRGRRQRMMYNLFPVYRVLLPLRRRYNDGRPITRPVELFYDPADLDPDAPRLRVDKREGKWELRGEDGTLVSTHAYLADALYAAVERSAASSAEILFRDASGRQEFSYRLNPDIVELSRLLRRSVVSGGSSLSAGRGGS